MKRLQLIKRLDLTQLAEALEVSPAHLCGTEPGRRRTRRRNPESIERWHRRAVQRFAAQSRDGQAHIPSA